MGKGSHGQAASAARSRAYASQNPAIDVSPPTPPERIEMTVRSQNLSPAETEKARRLRRKLKFFFLDPVQKFKLTGEIPWKLLAQIVKIVVVTIQVIQFGVERHDSVIFQEGTETMLRHVLLGNWSDVRDVVTWPPAQGPYAVYSEGGLQTSLAHFFLRYYSLNMSTFMELGYDYKEAGREDYPPIRTCISTWRKAFADPSAGKFDYDLKDDEICEAFRLNSTEREKLDEDDGYIAQIFMERGMSLANRAPRLGELVLRMDLKTIRGQGMTLYSRLACFDITAFAKWDNTLHTGIIEISLSISMKYSDLCEGTYVNGISLTAQALGIMLDTVVICICFLSFVLCSRALIRAAILQKETADYFEQSLHHPLSAHDRLEFVNVWYMVIVLNDCLTVAGTCIKLNLEYGPTAPTTYGYLLASFFLGSGALLVWSGILRYFGFFPQYNILILTLKKSMPTVIRFLACATLLYIGFLLWGWVVIGPYSPKFRTPYLTFANMFALINGDDMFATFVTLNENAPPFILVISKIYLVAFITVFINIVLSVFIAIIMDAYEIVKERLQPNNHVHQLSDFVNEDNTPLTGINRQDRMLPIITPVPSGSELWRSFKEFCSGVRHGTSASNESQPLNNHHNKTYSNIHENETLPGNETLPIDTVLDSFEESNSELSNSQRETR